jgi:hypothetical protein
MEAKHTPGPWRFIDDHPSRACLKVLAGDSEDLASLYFAPSDLNEPDEDGIWRGDDERVANARLMAAAPELLAALRGALKALDAIGAEMTVGDRFTNAGQYLLDALTPAREAISKATGGAA